MRDRTLTYAWQPRFTGRVVLGLIIMTLGALWTLDNLNIVESEPILRWWPVVIVAVGVAKLLGLGTQQNVVWGTVFVIAGGWILANSLDLLSIGIGALWPVGLVVLGFAILSRAWRGPAPVSTDSRDDPSYRLSSFAFWSGNEHKATSQQFQGGDLSAVMGGSDVDLTGAKPVPGGAVFDVFVWWGGIDIKVPEGWRVLNQSTAIMGAVEDHSKVPPPGSTDTLIIRGLILMGAVEIKN